MNRYLLLGPFRSARLALLVPYRHPAGIAAVHRLRLSQSTLPVQSAVVKPSLAKRAKKFWDDNPFTQIALLVCLLVVGVASLVEWAQNKKKGARPRSGGIFSSLPHKPAHPVFRREELSLLLTEADKNRFAAARVISIVGERGSGKTELARQLAEEIGLRDEKKGRIGKMYKPEHHVLTVDMSCRESMVRSLLKCAALLQVPSNSISPARIGCHENVTDEQLGALLATIDEFLRKKRKICILDNADRNMQELRIISSTKHWKPPSLIVVTSRDRLAAKTHMEVDLDRNKAGADMLGDWMQRFGFGGDYSRELANKLNCIVNNFEVSSLICHSLYLLKNTGEKVDLGRIDAINLQSISHTLQQQLPSNITIETERMNISSLSPLNQLQLIALLLQVSSSRISQHSADLIARLSHEWMLPLTALVSYLQTPLLELQEQLQASCELTETLPSPQPSDRPEAEMGYWEFIKHTWHKRQQMIELMKQQQRPKFNKLQLPQSIETLKESPLFVWEDDPSNGFHGVKFRSKEVHTLATGLFENRTISQMEQTELARAKALHTSSLLSKLSTFNPALHLQKYRSTLPGISKATPLSDPVQTHTLSFLHRIMQALAADFEKDSGISISAETLKCRLLANHGEHLLHSARECILLRDRVTGLRFRAATLRNSDAIPAAVAALREVASIQEDNKSTPLVELAGTYSQLGRLLLVLGQTDNGHDYYQQAASLYERAMSKLSSAQQLDHASLLYRYGVELACNKELEQSKSCLERSIAVLNVAGAQPSASQQQQLQALVLSSMVELAHVYISLGALSYAARMLSMAENLSKNLPKEEVPDLAQLFNLKALVKSLTGDKKAYLQLKQKAGDMFATVNDKPFVY